MSSCADWLYIPPPPICWLLSDPEVNHQSNAPISKIPPEIQHHLELKHFPSPLDWGQAEDVLKVFLYHTKERRLYTLIFSSSSFPRSVFFDLVRFLAVVGTSNMMLTILLSLPTPIFLIYCPSPSFSLHTYWTRSIHHLHSNRTATKEPRYSQTNNSSWTSHFIGHFCPFGGPSTSATLLSGSLGQQERFYVAEFWFCTCFIP